MTLDVALLALAPVALGLALYLTRRLETDDPLPATPETPRLHPAVLVSMLGLALIPGLMLLGGGPRHVIVGTLYLYLLFVTGSQVAVLSRGRQACRARVAGVVAPLLIFASLVSTFGLWRVTSFSESVLKFATCVVFMILALGALWIGRVTSKEGAPLLVAAVLVALMSGHRLLPQGDVTAEEVAAWVDAFDEDVDEMLDWEAMGRTAHWMRGAGVADPACDVPARVIREAIAAGIDVHPITFNGAFDAGLFGTTDLEPLRATREFRWARGLLEGEDGLGVGSGDAARIRLLVGLGALDDAERVRLVERLCVSWPDDEGIGRLETACQICLLLDLLGASDRVREHKARLDDLLLRSWCTKAPRYGASGGFSLYNDGGEHGADEEATWYALEIIARIGVPEGIDLDETAAWLRTEIRFKRQFSRWLDWEPLDSYNRDLHLTWLRLRTEYDVLEPPVLTVRVLAVLASALALMAYCVVIVLRARHVRILPPV